MSVIYTVKEGDEKLSSHSGLAWIGALINTTHLRGRIDQTLLMDCKEPKISYSDMVFSMTGLLGLGKPDYEAIKPFRENPFFSQSLGIKTCPSSPALRQRIDVIGNAFDSIIKEESADLIRRIAPQVSPVQTSCGNLFPIQVTGGVE